ncbi:hypothetical protein [Frigoribacterium sp. RIT-PI-h]|uniref:hypothetical protein n=1 Tax=Frigoribacterium sp. RIT-PI-h TaxID=1690245 RepID=UPI000AA971F7|nr:hypothetical protein [Frigoribacterium sp. RIT-PI-h]
MPDGFSVDFSALDKLAADLGKVPKDAGENVRKATEVSARKVKDQWKSKLVGARSLGQANRAISYDLKGGRAIRGSQIEAEIGADLGGQGSLVGIVEYGSPTLSPRGYGLKALEDTSEDFQRGLEKAIADAERKAGL